MIAAIPTAAASVPDLPTLVDQLTRHHGYAIGYGQVLNVVQITLEGGVALGIAVDGGEAAAGASSWGPRRAGAAANLGGRN